MLKTQNIIQRRELEPLLLKAKKIIKHYEKAADCAVSLLGPDCETADNIQDVNSLVFCSLCVHCQRNPAVSSGNKSCFLMHQEAVNEARRLGGAYVYICPAGFVFWTSPFYSGDRFAGAFLSGGVLGVERQKAADNFMRNCTDKIPREEIEHYLSGVPEKNGGEVKALAQMMLICADQVSGGGPRQAISGWSAISSGTGSSFVSNRQESMYTATGGKAAEQEGDKHANSGYAYPMDKERILLACLRRGDNGEAQKILRELLDILFKRADGNFQVFRLHAMELAVMLSRSANNTQDIDDDSVFETNNRYLKKIEEGRTQKEITEILAVIVERLSGKIFSFKGVRHSSALRKAERFIWDNYTRKISLREIAGASGLSAPYFSSVFKEEIGENLSNYLNRLRVEKASVMLLTTNMSISGISLACGFEDQSWFSKIFKNYSGISPGKYREQGGV